MRGAVCPSVGWSTREIIKEERAGEAIKVTVCNGLIWQDSP